jgi:hypothetical protein
MAENEQPRLVRFTMMAVYSDGFSQLIDVPEPDKVLFEFEDKSTMEITPHSTIWLQEASQARLIIDMKKNRGILTRIMPVPFSPDLG